MPQLAFSVIRKGTLRFELRVQLVGAKEAFDAIGWFGLKPNVPFCSRKTNRVQAKAVSAFPYRERRKIVIPRTWSAILRRSMLPIELRLRYRQRDPQVGGLPAIKTNRILILTQGYHFPSGWDERASVG